MKFDKNRILDKAFKFWDLLILVFFIAVAVTAIIISCNKEEGISVQIYENGKVAYTLDINVDREIILKHNRIQIKNKEVYVEYADCANQICVQSPKISKAGESICCLPNNLVIVILGKSNYDKIIGGGK